VFQSPCTLEHISLVSVSDFGEILRFLNRKHDVSFLSFGCVSLDPEVQEKRAQKRVGMKEYYEKHGGGDH
jgi:hypothetical protein